MLHRAKTLKGCRLDGLDQEIGRVADFYFDDRHWTVRYLVADTGNWLRGRTVLVSPYALLGIRDGGRIAVKLTRQQIEESPSIDSDKPVSRQFERNYHGYHGWPPYWSGPLGWGAYAYPYPTPAPSGMEEPPPAPPAKEWDPHLRGTEDVTGYHVRATDDEIGHVDDFVIDDATWAIRYLIVDTRNWWPGKKVLISPEWIRRVSWEEEKVFVNVTRDAVRRAPEYTDDSLLNRAYEAGLRGHYQKEAAWDAEDSGGGKNPSPVEQTTRHHTS